MGLRPGQAKGPWVGTPGGGTSLSNPPGGGLVYETRGGNTQISALAGFHDFFEGATLKPLWQDTPVITSGDWQLDAVNDTLDGIAENADHQVFRYHIEGDVDYSMRIDRNGASSCGLWFENEAGNYVRVKFTSTTISLESDLFVDIDVSENTADKWIRLVRFENTWYGYYKLNETDAWTLIGSATADLGQSFDAALDSANGAEIHEVHFYDNMFPQRVQGDASHEVALTDAATIAVDASLGNTFRVTLGGNRTMGAPANPLKNQKIIFKIYQDGTGGRTLAWNAIYRFSTDIPSPTISTGAGDLDYVGFIYNITDNKWDCIALVQGF